MTDRRRLGTAPPVRDQGPIDPEEVLRLGLSVRLDRPYHELKQFLLSEFERAYLTRMLEESAMNVSMASRSSGLSRKHIRTLMSKYGMVVRRDLTVNGDPCEDIHDPTEGFETPTEESAGDPQEK
jgi:propanediol utilization protein